MNESRSFRRTGQKDFTVIINEEFESLINEEIKQYESKQPTSLKSNWEWEEYDENTEHLQYSEEGVKSVLDKVENNQYAQGILKHPQNITIQSPKNELISTINELNMKLRTLETELADYKKQK